MKLRIGFSSILLALVFLLFSCANVVEPSSTENNTPDDGLSPRENNPFAAFAGSYSSANGSYNFNDDGTGTMGGAKPFARSAGGSTPFTWEITAKDANNANLTYGMLYVGNAGSGITFDAGGAAVTVLINDVVYSKGGNGHEDNGSSSGGNSPSVEQQQGNSEERGGADSSGAEQIESAEQQAGDSGSGNDDPGETTPESQPRQLSNGSYLLFAPGVNMESGWHDATKNGNNDSNLCWAATSGNVVAWWQDRYNDLHSANKISTELPQTAQGIFGTIKSVYSNAEGSTQNGVLWYMANASSAGRQGGFLLEYIDLRRWRYPNITAFKYQDSFTTLGGFSSSVINALKTGVIALGISDRNGIGHAITIWGAEYNSKTNQISKLYVTDSDDGGTVLKPYIISQANGYVKFEGHYYGYDRIKNILILYAP